MNKDESLDLLIKSINDLDFIKRLKELESIINKNDDINKSIEKMRDAEKKLVNAKYYGVKSDIELYEKELKNIEEEMSDIPFLDEYLELLEEAYLMVKNISLIIENEINL